LVKQLAETVAAHDEALAAGHAGRGSEPSDTPDTPELGATQAGAAEAPLLPNRDELLAAIRAAIDAHRIDMHLQPIVTLPQRKVRYYEALSRLRTEDGHMLPPTEFLEPAAAGGLLGRLDHLLLFRCVQVVRRLLIKNRDIGLFCNISATTLNDAQYFPQMVQFLEANRVLAPSLLLEFRQSAWRGMGPTELEGLATLRELGFRFCMDQVTDLRIEPRDLAERGVRFVKIPATVLLNRTEATDIHAADLSDLLHRHGISLIADHIEAENQVVELLDFDMRFGQGFLFSPPRPVRAEALQAVPERHEAAKRGDGSPQQPRAAAL
jgi:cyclic-di-GMP phosphodiesterase TipF (flagellum assembly factor)